MVGVLLVALFFGQEVGNAGIRQPESPPSPPVVSVFVGTLSAGGERFGVFKRGFRIPLFSRYIVSCGSYIAASGLLRRLVGAKSW
jgi:hypothetical protein